MTSIPVRVLNQDTTGVLSRVANGEVIEITNRGTPVARIVPVETSGLESLVARGRMTPPTTHGPLPMPLGELDTEIDSTDVVSELREERL